MPENRPNAGQAIADAFSKTLLGLAQQYPQIKQQERDNRLQDQLMQMRMQEANREKMLFDQQIALGRMNLATKNAELKKLMEEQAKTQEQKNAEAAAKIKAETQAKLGLLTGPDFMGALNSLPTGSDLSIGDIRVTTPNSPDGNNFSARDQLLYDRLGKEGFTDWIMKHGSGSSDKSLSAKDQMLYDQYFNSYPKELAGSLWAEHIEGGDSSARAANAYRSLLGIEGRALVNVSGSKPDDYAKAAEQSGFLPQYAAYGGTKISVQRRIWDRFNNGEIDEKTRDEALDYANKQFGDIYNSALNWANMRLASEKSNAKK